MKSREIAWLAFTEKGRALAQRLCASLGGEVSYTGDGVSLRDWTGKAFAESRALVFIGAAGIAVRASAPYLTGKAADPAVVAVDECARFAGTSAAQTRWRGRSPFSAVPRRSSPPPPTETASLPSTNGPVCRA